MNITKHKINITLVSVTTDEPISDVPCGSCTRCCELLSPYLTPDEVSSGRYPISLVDTPEGPAVVLFKTPTGGCSLLVNGVCSIYETRPLSCRQFDCRKGHHPKLMDVAKEKFGHGA